MAADGSRGPKPYTQRQASTVFLRVPKFDWPYVKRGVKTEFRAARGAATQAFHLQPPVPVVAYSIWPTGYEHKLMVLEAVWQEMLGAISEESLAAEGYATLADFRHYWCAREHRRFQPTRKVFAYRVRPWLPTDYADQAARLLGRLYGEFMETTQ